MKIEAAQRLLAFKKPDVQLLDKNHDKVINAFEALNKWYGDNADRGVEKGLETLDKLFDYDAYTKPLYRAFQLPKELVDTATKGQVLTISTGPRRMQSWTTSAKIALEFIDKQDYKSKAYGIFKLEKHSGRQLSNFKWINQVVDYTMKATKDVDDLYEIYMEAKALKGYLTQFDHEKEVILWMPPESTVKLVQRIGN